MRGAGEKGFCAGLDMKYTMENANAMKDNAESYKFQARLGRLNPGYAPGAPAHHNPGTHAAAGEGFSFVLASDIRIISPDARFCAAYINIGLGGAIWLAAIFAALNRRRTRL